MVSHRTPEREPHPRAESDPQPNSLGRHTPPGSQDDVAVEVTVRGNLTISARQIGKKLKWPAILIGVVAIVFGAPRLDIEIGPAIGETVEIRTRP
ncbi:hypothetical protein [Nocardia asteroides]|uniref:hypothetical protein n=1 Tax=Nocardia asteroides TaxID=1824 RepID=UPI00343D0E73